MKGTRMNASEIISVLSQMIGELNEDELNMVAHYIINHCGEQNSDSDAEYRNLFRNLICDPYRMIDEYHWNPIEDSFEDE
jgi:hypothetical protein